MKKELESTIKEWLRFVEMDRSTAQHLFNTMHPQPLEIICFHCQQAVEKAIKALFVLKEIEIVKIHDLGMLIKMIQTEIAFPDTIKISAISLTKYAATFRYPQSPDFDEALTRKALADMETVITWCKEQIVLAGYEIE